MRHTELEGVKHEEISNSSGIAERSSTTRGVSRVWRRVCALRTPGVLPAAHCRAMPYSASAPLHSIWSLGAAGACVSPGARSLSIPPLRENDPSRRTGRFSFGCFSALIKLETIRTVAHVLQTNPDLCARSYSRGLCWHSRKKGFNGSPASHNGGGCFPPQGKMPEVLSCPSHG